jgi:hypothetical protein
MYIVCGREKVDRYMKDDNKILIFSHTFIFHYMIRFHFDSLIVLPSQYFANGTLCDVSNFKRADLISVHVGIVRSYHVIHIANQLYNLVYKVLAKRQLELNF